MKRLWFILPLLFIFSCEDKVEKDTTPPEVTITAPSSGSTVNEVVNVTCMATDNKEVLKVELWIGGVNTGLTDDTEPYSFQWNTTKYNDGDHTLIVRGYDTSENEGDSPPVTVKIDNTVSVPNSISVKSADFSSGGFTIEWSKSTDGDFKSYTIEHSVEPQMNDYENIFTAEDVNVTTTRMENTSPLIYHYFRVTVTDTFLYQTKGAIFTSKLDPIPDSVDVKSVTYDFEKMTVEWNKSSESDFDYYTVLWSKTEDGNKDLMGKYDDINIVSHSVSSFDPTQENWFWVMVTDTLGQSKIGNGKTNTIEMPPTESTQYPINYDGSSFYFRWSKNNDNDFAKYILYKSENSNLENKTVLKEFTNQSDTTYIETNVAYDQIWYYQIAVADKWNLMNWSGSTTGSSYRRIVSAAFLRNNKIATIDVNGNAIRTLVERETINNTNYYENAEYPFFSPDGTKILFSARDDGKTYVYTMNSDGTDKKRISNDDDDIRTYKKQLWSPNGNQILYYTEQGLVLINADGTGKKIIYTGFSEWLQFFPDGENILLGKTIIDIDGANEREIISTGIDHPQISPDGTKIIFTSNQLYIMDSDGSNKKKLTATTSLWPKFSPDGTKIVFINEQGEKVNNQTVYTVATINIDGNNLKELTEPKTRVQFPQFNPEGTKIYWMYYPGNNAVWRMDLDGSNIERVLPLNDYKEFDFQPRPED